MKYIESLWESYRQQVVPPDAGPTQIAETRLAFFAGAATLFDKVISNLTGGGEAEEPDIQMLSDINQEIVDFHMEAEAGAAEVSSQH